jgi:3-isopropylmalate/(R)-2-methylmalate dehydratase small subunit
VEPFEKLTSVVIPLKHRNVDTDQIIPARFLKTIEKDGLAGALFADWRQNADGSPMEEFVLNQPAYQGAGILLAEENFGCGSSREHAVWALASWGIRTVIAPSFADIFRSNALKNGLLAVELTAAQVEELFALSEEQPGAQLTVDLSAQTVSRPDGVRYSFRIDPFARHCLLEGVDQLGYLLSREAEIAAFEALRADRPPAGRAAAASTT